MERREQQKQAERERQSPRLCIEALAALTPELQQATAGSDAATASLDPWLARLPLPPSMAAIMDPGLALFFPRISRAVPWSTLVRTKGKPNDTWKPVSWPCSILNGIRPWSW